jgi:hypothetical protein
MLGAHESIGWSRFKEKPDDSAICLIVEIYMITDG